jgi:hypothetical protein
MRRGLSSIAAAIELVLIFGSGALYGWSIRGEETHLTIEAIASPILVLSLLTAVGAAWINRTIQSRSLWRGVAAQLYNTLASFDLPPHVEAIVYIRTPWHPLVRRDRLKARTPYVSSRSSSGPRAKAKLRAGVGIVGCCYSMSDTYADYFDDEAELVERSRAQYHMADPNAQRKNMRSMFAVPIWRANERAIGVIFVRSTQVDTFARARTTENANLDDWVRNFDRSLKLIGDNISG